MAMTKAEKAAMDALYERAALSWPAPPPKPVDLDVAMEGSGKGRWRGWWMNPYSKRVGEGVVDGCLHALEPYTDEQLNSRYGGHSYVSLSQTRGGPWYATKADAMRALHYAVAAEYAKGLARIQRLIEDEA